MHFSRVMPIVLCVVMLPALLSGAKPTPSTQSKSVNSLLVEETVGKVDLIVLPERTQTERTGSINLMVVLKNSFAEKLEVIDFVLLNPSLTLQTVSSLPKEVAPNQVSNGVYTLRIKEKAQYILVSRLTYKLKGQERSISSQAEIKVQDSKDSGRDIALVFVGAVSSIMGGIVTEAVRGWLGRQREFEQQASKAVGLLLPSLDVCFHAVKNNQDAPISLWNEVYFKEGLHVALAKKAESLGVADVTSTIAELYARLTEYNANKHIVNRDPLKADLKKIQQTLQKFT